MLHWLYIFYKRKEIILWHTLLVMVASAADHALLSALYQLFLREILSLRSIPTHASTAVLAQLSALYQLFLRVESKRKNNKRTVFQVHLVDRPFLFLHLAKPNERENAQHFRVRRVCIWRSQMNEETRSVFECTGTCSPFIMLYWQTWCTREAIPALRFRWDRFSAWL